MKKYLVIDTGEIWTEKELESSYENFKHEMAFNSYGDYADHLLELGRLKQSPGIIQIE